MKKLIVFSLVFALIAGAAFAQVADGISIGGWGRAAFAPLIIEGKLTNGEGNEVDYSDGVYAGTGVNWGNFADVEWEINGNGNDYVGFGLLFVTDSGSGFSELARANVWVQPFASPVFKLIAGNFHADQLRGKIGEPSGGFESFIDMDTPDKDGIFSRFRASNGFMLSSEPVDGLFIGAAVNTGGNLFKTGVPLLDEDGEPVVDEHGDPMERDLWQAWAKNVYRNIQIGFGYNIPDIGHARLQYVGGFMGNANETDYKDFLAGKNPGYELGDEGSLARVEAAFALTAVENLTLDLGFKFGLPYTIDFESEYLSRSDGLNINLGAKYSADAFNIAAYLWTGFGGYERHGKDDKDENGLDFGLLLVPSYDLGGAEIGMDIGFKLTGNGKDAAGNDKKDGSSQFGISAWVQKGFDSGLIKAGVAFQGPSTPSNSDFKARDGMIIRIPVILEYWF